MAEALAKSGKTYSHPPPSARYTKSVVSESSINAGIVSWSCGLVTGACWSIAHSTESTILEAAGSVISGVT